MDIQLQMLLIIMLLDQIINCKVLIWEVRISFKMQTWQATTQPNKPITDKDKANYLNPLQQFTKASTPKTWKMHGKPSSSLRMDQQTLKLSKLSSTSLILQITNPSRSRHKMSIQSWTKRNTDSKTTTNFLQLTKRSLIKFPTPKRKKWLPQVVASLPS